MKITHRVTSNDVTIEWHGKTYELDKDGGPLHYLAIRQADELQDIDADITRTAAQMMSNLSNIVDAVEHEIHVNNVMSTSAIKLDQLVERRRETARLLSTLLHGFDAARVA